MRGSKLQKARAERRDKWFEKEYDVPKYPIMERDRKKLNFDQGREIHNWDDLAALSRTGRPETSKPRKKAKTKTSTVKIRSDEHLQKRLKPSGLVKAL